MSDEWRYTEEAAAPEAIYTRIVCVEPGCHFEGDDERLYCEQRGHARERRTYMLTDQQSLERPI